MRQIANSKGVPIPLAVWLARDTYDYQKDPNYLSATQILRSIKTNVLSSRIPQENTTVDIHDLVPSRIGTAIHDSIEQAWNADNLPAVLDALGYTELSNKVRVNPAVDSLEKDVIPVFMEQRAIKEIDGFKIGGKFDFVFDGTLIDFKSTSTFTFVNSVNNAKYQLQGSIYRWLNPDIITDDFMEIHYIFTDWKPTLADTQKDYPAARAMAIKIPLLSLEETLAIIKKRIAEIKQFRDADESSIPACNDEELWRRPTTYKYFSNPTNTRATKNFSSLYEANTFMANKGKGIVREVKGEVIACKYCDAFAICKQKDQYLATGELSSF